MAARTKKTSGWQRLTFHRLAGVPAAFASAFARSASSTDVLARAVVVALWLAVAAGLILAGRRGVPWLLSWAESRQTVDSSTVEIRFEPTPSWMPVESLALLVADGRAALPEGSLFDAGALTALHRHLVLSGWFERVEQVTRLSATEIVVSAEFLTPFALVRSGEADCVVDREARRLPLTYTGSGPRPQLPRIVGVSLPRPAEPGTPWIGRDVRAALRLAALIRARPWFLAGQVREIDANRFNSESILELVTDRGTRVIWGGDPEGRAIGEMPAERKLACLDALYHGTRRIDDSTGRALDLRFDVVTLAPTDPTMPLTEHPGRR